MSQTLNDRRESSLVSNRSLEAFTTIPHASFENKDALKAVSNVCLDEHIIYPQAYPVHTSSHFSSFYTVSFS